VVELVLILLGIVAVFAMYGVAIGGSVDALGQPREVWTHAGFRRRSWIWQAVAVFCVPAAVVYSGMYYFRVRPRLMAASREMAQRRALLTAVSWDRAALAVDDVLTIRMPWSVSIASVCGPLVGAVVGLALAGGLTDFDGSAARLLVPYGVAVVVLAPLTRIFSVRLTADAVIMRGLLRRRIAWSEVEMFQEYSTLGARSVRLWTRGGRRHRLRAPCTMLGLGRVQFDRDAAAIQRWSRSLAGKSYPS
jgi:hypothetical protein